MIFASVFPSTAESESSKIKISGFLINARAIEILCFWPPDNATPFSPTSVSN